MPIQIPRQQIFDRWDTLSDKLKDAIVSETNSEIAWKAGEVEHLPKEKTQIVSRLTGYVLMGFVHPEDFAGEIKDALGINPNIAASIADTLNKRIFAPLKDELEKVYAPALPETQQPKILDSISSPQVDSITSRPSGEARSAGAAPQVEEINPVRSKPPLAAATIPLSAGGRTSNGIKKPSETTSGKPEVPKAEVSVADLTAIPKPPTGVPRPPKQDLGSKVQDPNVITQHSTLNTQNSEVPGPVIIHRESEFEPIRQAAGFKLEIQRPDFRETKIDWKFPPKPAQIEISSMIEDRGSGVGVQGSRIGDRGLDVKTQNSEMPVNRIVNYGGLRTALAVSGLEPPKPKETFPEKSVAASPRPTVPRPPAPKPPPPPQAQNL